MENRKNCKLTIMILSLMLFFLIGISLVYIMYPEFSEAVSEYKQGKTVPAQMIAETTKHRPVSSDVYKDRYLNWMYRHSTMPKRMLDDIYATVKRHPYSDLILAIMYVESRFNPFARSKKGAVGLLQVMPQVWSKELKKEGIIEDKRDLYLIDKNIESGLYIFKKYMEKTKSLEKTLIKYVGGDKTYSTRVLKALGELYIIKENIENKA